MYPALKNFLRLLFFPIKLLGFILYFLGGFFTAAAIYFYAYPTGIIDPLFLKPVIHTE